MGIGFKELLVILVIVLVLFGAKRLGSIGSDLGSAIKNFRKALREGEGDDEPPAAGQSKEGNGTGRVIEGEAAGKHNDTVNR